MDFRGPAGRKYELMMVIEVIGHFFFSDARLVSVHMA